MWVVFIILVGLLFFAGIAFIEWDQARLNKTLVDTTPITPIHQLEPGPVGVHGSVKPQAETVISPWAQKECVFFRIRVERYQHSGNNYRWLTYIDHQEPASFLVDDGTGSVEAQAKDAHLSLQPDKYFTDMGDELPEHLSHWMGEELGKKTEGIFGDYKLRFS